MEIDIAQLSENAKSSHFSTFSNRTPCIYYVQGINTFKKEKSRRKKCLIFFITLLGFVPTISELQAV